MNIILLQENWVSLLLWLLDVTSSNAWSSDTNRDRLLATSRNNTGTSGTGVGAISLHILLSSVVDVVDGTTDGTSPCGSTTTSSVCSDDDILDAHDVSAVGDPVEGNVAENVDKADQWDDHGNASVCGISNCSLDWGKDSSSCDTHDQNTSTTTSMDTKICDNSLDIATRDVRGSNLLAVPKVKIVGYIGAIKK